MTTTAKKALIAASLGLVLMAGSCEDDANIATANIKKAAEVNQ